MDVYTSIIHCLVINHLMAGTDSTSTKVVDFWYSCLPLALEFAKVYANQKLVMATSEIFPVPFWIVVDTRELCFDNYPFILVLLCCIV